MGNETRPARFNAPATVALLIVPPGSDGMLCVGRSIKDGRGDLLFAGRRPDGKFPTPQGWLPDFVTAKDAGIASINAPGTAGEDDSGWRVGYGGVVPTAELGKVYGRGDPIGNWIPGPGAELAVFWLEDNFPDRLVNIDPAGLIPGLRPAVPWVSTGPGVWRVPAIVTSNTADEARGSIHITSGADGQQQGVVRSGRVVAFAAGGWQFAVGYTPAADRARP